VDVGIAFRLSVLLTACQQQPLNHDQEQLFFLWLLLPSSFFLYERDETTA
jgi:hypothetical protein